MDTNAKASNVQIFAWSVSALAAAVAIIAWGQGIDWQFGSVNALTFFPLLGLVAFGLMWSHYVTSYVRRQAGVDKTVLRQYITITGYIVLVAILLHPALLIYGLFKQGYGLPPNSYLQHYIAPGMAWASMLGTLSLLVFLSYEFHRVLANRSWWRYVTFASDMAMFAILLHSLTLGQNLQQSWLTYVWYVYGITLTFVLFYNYTHLSAAKNN